MHGGVCIIFKEAGIQEINPCHHHHHHHQYSACIISTKKRLGWIDSLKHYSTKAMNEENNKGRAICFFFFVFFFCCVLLLLFGFFLSLFLQRTEERGTRHCPLHRIYSLLGIIIRMICGCGGTYLPYAYIGGRGFLMRRSSSQGEVCGVAEMVCVYYISMILVISYERERERKEQEDKKIKKAKRHENLPEKNAPWFHRTSSPSYSLHYVFDI